MSQHVAEGFEVDELDDEALEDVSGGGFNFLFCKEENTNCGDACSPEEESPTITAS